MKSIRYNLKKYIWNVPFMAAAIAMGWIYYEVSEVIGGFGVINLLSGLQEACVLTHVMYIAPMMACFPYVMKFHEEKNSKSYQYMVLRVGKIKYAVRKVLEAALSGALVMLFAVLVFTLLSCSYGIMHKMQIVFADGGLLTDGFYGSWVEEGLGIAVYLVILFVLAVQGAFWACVGTVISMFVSNKRLAVVSPFLLVRISIYVFEKDAVFFLRPTNLNFTNWMTEQPFGGIPYALGYAAVSIVFSIIIVYFGINRFMRR